MLKAGTCICPKCGKIFEMAYYYNAPSATGAVLHYSDKHKGYWIEPYFPGNPRRTADPGFSLRIISGPSPDAEGMPHSIRVLRAGPDGSRQELMMKHSCPECATNTVLYKNYGAFPLYVIALAGLTETGKSAWLTAISNPSNLARLSDAGFPCRIEPASFHGSRSPAESTAAGSLG